MKRLTVLAAIISVFTLLGAQSALADNCVGAPPGLGGTIIAGECVINAPVVRTGTFNLDETLRITGNGRIDTTGGALILNICVAPATPGTCDLILEKPIAATGGQIEGNNAGIGSDITIKVSRDVLMQAGSAILADDTGTAGHGGNITITAGDDMTMCGQTGLQPGCGAPGGKPGALISAQKKGGGATTLVNSVTITVGSTATATGDFYMEGGTTGYGTENGAKIITDSTTGKSGTITITTGATYFTEPGAVIQSGFGGGTPGATSTQIGGKIYIVSDCGLTSEGRITSKGPDPGADLVHLESCTVVVRGLVESTGKGHTSDAPNNCDLVNDSLPGEVFRNHPAESTGCIEVWGNFITIDSSTLNPATNLPWAGELNADIGNGGPTGTSWIDIFAFSKLTVLDGTGNDRTSNNGGHTYFSTYAVHANAINGSDNNPGLVTAKVKNGPLTASGKAFEASSTLTAATGHTDPGFVGNGSNGGTVDLEALGNINLDTAFVNASGDSPSPSAGELGGVIIVSAWNAGSTLSWQNGYGDVRPNATSATTGIITLNAPGGVNTTGTNFNGAVPALSAIADATKPDIPVISVRQRRTSLQTGPLGALWRDDHQRHEVRRPQRQRRQGSRRRRPQRLGDPPVQRQRHGAQDRDDGGGRVLLLQRPFARHLHHLRAAADRAARLAADVPDLGRRLRHARRSRVGQSNARPAGLYRGRDRLL